LTAISTQTSTGIETAGGLGPCKVAFVTLDNVCCGTRGGSSGGQDASVRAGTLVVCWSKAANTIMGFLINDRIKDVGKNHQRLGLESECS
jgi:hypothetical protein